MTETSLGLDDSPTVPGTIETPSFTMRNLLAALTQGGQGVWRNFRDELQVTQNSLGPDKSVDVAMGAANVGDGENNCFYSNSATKNLEIAANSSGNPRIDTIAVDFDETQADGSDTVQAVVVQGTPAGSPSPPSLTQTATRYQMPIAHVAVADGFTSITDSEITDRRQFVGEQSGQNALSQVVDLSVDGTTYADHPDFKFYSPANSHYRIWLVLLANFNATNNMKIHFEAPSGYNYEGLIIYKFSINEKAEQLDEVSTTMIDTDATNQPMMATFYLKVAATPGEIRFQIAEHSGGAGVSTLLKESFMLWEKIA